MITSFFNIVMYLIIKDRGDMAILCIDTTYLEYNNKSEERAGK